MDLGDVIVMSLIVDEVIGSCQVVCEVIDSCQVVCDVTDDVIRSIVANNPHNQY